MTFHRPTGRNPSLSCIKNPQPDCFATQQAVESKAFRGLVTILFFLTGRKFSFPVLRLARLSS